MFPPQGSKPETTRNVSLKCLKGLKVQTSIRVIGGRGVGVGNYTGVREVEVLRGPPSGGGSHKEIVR